ncbi:MAG: hypothetical protein WAN48_15100, partial [Actinomycetes bacterium]
MFEPDSAGDDADALAAQALDHGPGPRSAALLERVSTANLSEEGRLDFLQAAAALVSWATSLDLPVLVDHVGRDDVPNLAPSDWRGLEQHGRVIEAAVAKNVSETTLRNQLWVAREVTGRLDRTGTSLR